jgi:hypothetical protein
MPSEWCKFCKHAYCVVESGEYSAYCYLSHFGYPVKKDPQDTCENFESEEDDDA